MISGHLLNGMTAWSMVRKLEMEKRPSKEERAAASEMEYEMGDCSGESDEWTSSESEAEQPGGKSALGSYGHTLFQGMDISSKPHRQLCRSPCLDRPSFSQSSIQVALEQPAKCEDAKSSLDREYQAKMDFALKLGYNGEQIQAVLNKLGADALINDVLAELVRLGNKGESDAQTNAGGSTGNLVPRGLCTKEIASPELSLEDEIVDNTDNLKPIVIDGSNVAMRLVYRFKAGFPLPHPVFGCVFAAACNCRPALCHIIWPLFFERDKNFKMFCSPSDFE